MIEQVDVGRRAILASVLCVVIMGVDAHTNWLEGVRLLASVVLYPIHELARAPEQISTWSKEAVRTRSDLMEENDRLNQENFYLRGRLQKYASLMVENARLRELLGSTEALEFSVLVGEVVGIDPDPYRAKVVVNKGAANGVYKSQPVLDANGLLGQVVEVQLLTSRVLLLTDALHAVPVRVVRSGAHAIAVGGDGLDHLTLLHVSQTADIREGDLLVASGLGARFPRGYPVAEVTSVELDNNQTYMKVKAKPLASVDSVSHVLFVDMKASSAGDSVESDEVPEEVSPVE